MRVFRNNPKYLDRAYLHTVLHCIFSHLWIRGNRDVRKWNLACDIAVEYTIDGMNKPCTRRILSWSRQKLYEELRAEKRGISAAVVYRYLYRKKPEEIIRHAVKGMLPDGKLGRQMFKKLKVYAGPEHAHAAQKPEKLEF